MANIKNPTEALELTLKQWTLIREVVESLGFDDATDVLYLKAGAIDKMGIGFRPIYNCFCCEFAGKIDGRLDCSKCPMAGFWSDDGSHKHGACERCEDSPYEKLYYNLSEEDALPLVDDMINRINLAIEHHKVLDNQDQNT